MTFESLALSHLGQLVLFSDLYQMELRNLSLRMILLCVGICAGCAAHKVKSTPDDALTLIFNRAASIKVLSYANEPYQVPQIEGEEEKNIAQKDTVFRVVSDLHISESTIKEEIELNRRQCHSLFRLLKTEMCEVDEGAICYYPRHAILFYDSNSQPFSYIEICFECTNYQTPGNFEIDFCYEKSQAIKNLFQAVGVKYFEVGER